MFSVYRYVVGSGTQDKAGAKRVRNSLSRGCKRGLFDWEMHMLDVLLLSENGKYVN